jgi:predicted nuclease with RNAse H fold
MAGVRTWLGVDVGGARKGFDAALLAQDRLLELSSRLNVEGVVALADAARAELVAIDSPRCCAPEGHTARECERALARAICGIRWTPDRAHVARGDYYDWIRQGLELYAELAARGIQAIEVFPTASWTRWFGPRHGTSRSAWSREALAALDLAGVPARTNQDQRDAIAAGVTACQHAHGLTELIGEIVVPAR